LLSTNLFVHTTTPQRLFARAQQYAACLSGMQGTPEDSRAQPPTDVPPNDLSLAERIAALPPGERQTLTRHLVLTDAGLQRALLQEAAQQVADPEDKRRLTVELRHAKHALAQTTEQMTRYQQLIAKLEEDATAARVRQARLEDDLEELRQLRKDLESGKRASATSLAELK
jgi:chromosome segregation ATPase